MDFSFTEAQTAVAELARKLFAERVTPAALKATEARDDRFFDALWIDLAATGLLGTAIPEASGGSGHGLLELSALLVEAGAAVAPVPLLPTLVYGALPIAEFGSEAQRRWLSSVVAGETILTAALAEPANDDPLSPTAHARRAGAGFVLDGAKHFVPAAHLAKRILVPARIGEAHVGIFLVDPNGAGVTLERQVLTTGEPHFVVTLRGAEVAADDVLGTPEAGRAMLSWLLDRATVALCALELGVCERALRITASYTTNRMQFDRPIASFQAVAQRAADAYVDVESIRLATWHAAFRLAHGLPASRALATAKLFAAEAGHRVVYAAQHLHGGMGFDVDYPLHRHYLWSKQLELTLGSGTEALVRLGDALASDQ